MLLRPPDVQRDFLLRLMKRYDIAFVLFKGQLQTARDLPRPPTEKEQAEWEAKIPYFIKKWLTTYEPPSPLPYLRFTGDDCAALLRFDKVSLSFADLTVLREQDLKSLAMHLSPWPHQSTPGAYLAGLFEFGPHKTYLYIETEIPPGYFLPWAPGSHPEQKPPTYTADDLVPFHGRNSRMPYPLDWPRKSYEEELAKVRQPFL